MATKQAATRFTNNQGIHLAVAVWLADDDYQYSDIPNAISVTTLIKSPKQILLSMRVPAEQAIPDIADRIASRMGQALHSGIEHSWKNKYAESLKKLGYPPGAIKCIRINPEQQEPDTIPVYIEVRNTREIAGVVVTGQVDLIIEGRLHDVKKTSVWGYQNMTNVEDKWKLQASIYRWLNPEKIVHDELFVQYLLLDWSRAFAKRDPNYPPHAVPHRVVPMLSLAETENWIRNRLTLLSQLKDAPEESMPECSDDDLWRSAPVYKYYSVENPQPGQRSSKNFDDMSEAMKHLTAKGKGTVLKKPGQVSACKFCEALPICQQARNLVAIGDLVI